MIKDILFAVAIVAFTAAAALVFFLMGASFAIAECAISADKGYRNALMPSGLTARCTILEESK